MNPFYSMMASGKVRSRWLEWEGNQDENADLITAPWKSDHASGLMVRSHGSNGLSAMIAPQEETKVLSL